MINLSLFSMNDEVNSANKVNKVMIGIQEFGILKLLMIILVWLELGILLLRNSNSLTDVGFILNFVNLT